MANTLYDSMPPANYAQDLSQSDEQYVSTFFCRALYDYQTNDTSSLSFRKDDIIEVLTQLDSGWWDGLLGDERGWFPSNYVTVISDQEAEAALGGPEFASGQSSLPDDSMVDMAQSISQALSQSDPEVDWLNGGDSDYSQPSQRVGHQNGRASPRTSSTQQSDFWVPRVGQDGQIFYVNTQTGQQSRDLPMEADDEADSEVAALSPQSSSRAGPSAALGLAAVNGSSDDDGPRIPKPSRTPEPWVRRLTDDGLSYYYVNKVDGQVSWTLPPSNAPPAYVEDPMATTRPLAVAVASSSSQSGSTNGRDLSRSTSRLRSGSTVSRSTRERSDSSVADRLSVHSDDSEIYPIRRERGESGGSSVKQASNGLPARPNPSSQSRLPPPLPDITAAEDAARMLQESLSPPPPESAIELSNHVRAAISAVLRYLKNSMNPRRPEQYREVDQLVLNVVSAVRNLLYVTATPTGHVPSHLYPRDPRDRATSAGQTLQAHLKAAHRKVAGTLSKLVLSALAMQYDPGLSSTDKPNRMESDVAELERAVVAFVVEVQFFQEQNGLSKDSLKSVKRLHGVFSTTNLGLGLPGAGFGADWRGFGFVPPEEGAEVPQRNLDNDVLTELSNGIKPLESRLGGLVISLKYLGTQSERVALEGQNMAAQLSAFLRTLANINVAQHVDIDGVRQETGFSSASPQYMQTVDRAQGLMRTLEAATQALYDDGVALFSAVQYLGAIGAGRTFDQRDRAGHVSTIETTAPVVRGNCLLALQTLEGLLTVGHDQSEISQGDYRNSIEWRTSRINIGGAALSSFAPPEEEGDDEFVDIGFAFNRPKVKTVNTAESSGGSTLYGSAQHPSQSSLDMSDRSRSGSMSEPETPTWSQQEASVDGTLVASEQESPHSPLDDELLPYVDDEAATTQTKRGGAGNKLMKLLGPDAPQHYISKLNADAKPWYLRPNYDQSEILIDPDGSVRAGTATALVERLTAHETGDATFIKNFLMTFKSFMSVDELFDLLVARFWIQPPPNLNPTELVEWTRLKQNVIRLRVINTFRTMIADDDILEKEDMYILTRMKEFASNEEVITVVAAKNLLILIERAQKGGDAPIKTSNVPMTPPAPILPKSSKKLKLLDIDPLEIGRQLTLMEATLYKKIRPMECLQRSRETKPGRTADNITSIIQLSNRIANWVAESVLAREDSQKRARVVKHFINVADRCRVLQNYSTMTAVVSGLNTPPIRRLKRTWEQVNAKFMSQLKVCESTIDTNKNFNNYRQTLARISPPCVPFIGVYLTTLTFINDGAEDKLAGNMINFRKRQKAAEVIQDIKRWQSSPYNYQTVGSILTYLEESFNAYQDGVDYGDQFWNLSLEREPREREDEKMARLLQESGFL